MENQNTLFVITIIIGAIIGLIVLYFILKPYIIRYDTTLLFTGGLGAGKTLNAVKQSTILIRKTRFFNYYLWNFKTKYIVNPFNKLLNKINTKRIMKGKAKVRQIYSLRKKPKLYSNIPIHFKPSLLSTQREWSEKLTTKHIFLLEEITEFSIVLIDEMPMFVSQHEWDEEIVKTNLKEFITYFRHYIGGWLVLTSQSETGIVKEVRTKLNVAIFCFDLKIWPSRLTPLFYTCRMCDMMISENVSTVNTTFIENNTRLYIGFMPPKGCYDTRCYSERYKNILLKNRVANEWHNLKTNEVLRLKYYISPCDIRTTESQKRYMLSQIEKLETGERK